MKFDPEKHYIGTLCNRKHTYQGKKKSLRYHTNKTCVLCHALNGKDYVPKPKKKDSLKSEKEREEIRVYASINCNKYRKCLDKISKASSDFPCHECGEMAFKPDSFKQELRPLNHPVDEHSMKIPIGKGLI